MILKNVQLINREAVIASQNRHLGRSLYSVPFPIKLVDILIVNSSKSSFTQEIKQGIGTYLTAVSSNIPYSVSSITTTNVVYEENFRLPIHLTSVNSYIPYDIRSLITTKLEATVVEADVYLTAIETPIIPYYLKELTVTTSLVVISHKQLIEEINSNTSQSTFEVK